MSRSPITTHVLDTAAGRAAAGVPVTLEREEQGSWKRVGQGTTNADGRVADLLPAGAPAQSGLYRITFDLDAYYQGKASFYPYAVIAFRVQDPAQHYHVPLLVSGFGFSTYRGT